MSLSYDLHTHSQASDGTLSPATLIGRAKVRGVNVLALTDHDTTDGLDEARTAASHAGLTFVPGVEVSVSWNGLTVHVVGLNVDASDAALQEGLARLRAFRNWRAEEIGRGLERAGIHAAYAGARALAQGAVVSRTHFARYLVERGYAQSISAVFRKFLTRGKPGHVPGQWATLDESVGWIRSAGGQAVLAHPARYRLTATRLRQLLEQFKTCGGEGLEVVSGSQGHNERRELANYARHYGFVASCGSDFHTPGEPWLELGKLPQLPTGCVPIWHDWETTNSSTESVVKAGSKLRC